MTTTTMAFQAVARNLPKSLERAAAVPQTANETAHYLEHIGEIKSIDDFMANDRIYRFAMKAFGLEEMTYAKGLIRKVLSEGVDGSNTFANKLSDPRYKELATTFNFARYGSATTSFDKTQKPIAERYVRQVFEEQQGSQNENVRLALYFERKASGIKNAYEVLADPALLKVVQTALGIPSSTSMIPIDKQAEMIAKKLDFATLKDAEGVKDFLLRFTSLADIGASQAAASSALTILVGPPVAAGVSTDVLFSIQNLRLGGI
ncbi:DUF1217 domain-containing protein [Bosea sp. (in: a-proteobacteria)]|uniref:DUF1217 domain-containing protein n=1 Tax=Bosea sp. (in: a-proteobacteria) TaxID=1871050 RepID=UPI0027343D80|nr:DUF1217 domain-containing protein [Bosea sp. (in: a-proteobacteria)]MDP3408768.1 DUF1217 domain-containing protein [Bosea sp. (in: a-proteobacteria)]